MIHRRNPEAPRVWTRVAIGVALAISTVVAGACSDKKVNEDNSVLSVSSQVTTTALTTVSTTSSPGTTTYTAPPTTSGPTPTTTSFVGTPTTTQNVPPVTSPKTPTTGPAPTPSG
jgi:hypothetical protein